MYGYLRYKDKYVEYICSGCGNVETNTSVESVRDRMAERMLCFSCNYFEDYVQGNQKPTACIIDGRMYSPGNNTTGNFRGCGGRRFDIEFIAGPYAGKRITTFDLWVGGQFPERLRKMFPDTARFLGGAKQVQVGEITCFNNSDRMNEPYPLPKTIGLI